MIGVIIREYLSARYGLRLSTDVCGSRREKTVFHEKLQEACFALPRGCARFLQIELSDIGTRMSSPGTQASRIISYNAIASDIMSYNKLQTTMLSYERNTMIRYDSIRFDSIRYDTIHHITIRYDTTRHDTISLSVFLYLSLSISLSLYIYIYTLRYELYLIYIYIYIIHLTNLFQRMPFPVGSNFSGWNASGKHLFHQTKITDPPVTPSRW